MQLRQQAALRELAAMSAHHPVGPPAPLPQPDAQRFVPCDASPCDNAAITYQREAEYFDAALARHIINHRPEVTHQMRKVAWAAWNLVRKTDPARLTKFGEDNADHAGAVGCNLKVLEKVALSGNLRETVGFLLTGERNKAFKRLTKFSSRKLLEEHRADRQKVPVVPQRKLLSEVCPPLSEAESRGSLQSSPDSPSYVEWRRGEQFLTLRLTNQIHVNAEPTGGLVTTGLSGSAMVLLQIAQLAKDQGTEGIDLELVRLAALAVFVEHGHHTAHEVLLSAHMWAVDTGSAQKLPYDDTYRRYRSISPLTEKELRNVARNSQFPDELMNPPAVPPTIQRPAQQPFPGVYHSVQPTYASTHARR